jgi:hypothetical protein
MSRPGALLLVVLGLATSVPAFADAARSVGSPSILGDEAAGSRLMQRGSTPRGLRQWRRPDRRGPSQEPAAARGYADGYQRGLEDGRDRDRYDPVGHESYRSGDAGYHEGYGSRDAYRTNYRAGFRQGYEDGYRDGSRGRR